MNYAISDSLFLSSSMHTSEKTLPGDILLVSAFISYVGCFTKHYRRDLMEKMWLPLLQKLNVSTCILFYFVTFMEKITSFIYVINVCFFTAFVLFPSLATAYHVTTMTCGPAGWHHLQTKNVRN